MNVSKPCPFCESPMNVVERKRGPTVFVTCRQCCAQGPESDCSEGALEKWNLRRGAALSVNSPRNDGQNGESRS